MNKRIIIFFLFTLFIIGIFSPNVYSLSETNESVHISDYTENQANLTTKEINTILKDDSILKYFDASFYGVTSHFAFPPWSIIELLIPDLIIPPLPALPYLLISCKSKDRSVEPVAHVRIATSEEVLFDQTFNYSVDFKMRVSICNDDLFPFMDIDGGNIHGVGYFFDVTGE